MKIAFLPFGIVGGILAGSVSKKLFETVWRLIDKQEPPDAEHRRVGYGRLVVALLLEGAVFRLVRGLFDHGSRQAFARLTGQWPGDEAPETK